MMMKRIFSKTSQKMKSQAVCDYIIYNSFKDHPHIPARETIEEPEGGGQETTAYEMRRIEECKGEYYVDETD